MVRLKWFLIGLAILLFFGGYAGYKYYYKENYTKTNNERIKITFINGFTGGDGSYMKKITEGFNQSQENYQVIELQEKDYYTKFKSGNYDLVVIHGNNLKTYKKDGLIQTIGPVLEKAGIKETDFHPAGRKVASIDGKLYAVPLDIHPLTMFYNKELSSKQVTSYKDLQTLNSKLQKDNQNTYALGIPSAGLVEYYALTIAAQNNINLQKDNYLNFSQPEFADALMTFHDMVWKENLSPSNLGTDGDFQTFMKEASKTGNTKQAAVALTGPWYYAAAKDTYGDDLGVAPIPRLGDKQAVYGNSHTIALSSKVEDPEVLKGIEEFLKYMYEPENMINWADGGQSPVHLPTIDVIKEQKDKYPLAYANQQQFDTFVPAPSVYLFNEQVRYLNDTVFSRLILTKNYSKAQLMKELDKATSIAKQIAETEPRE
ncbi:extracellular solute-binding protein [Priestia flexa]|uniref:extracellular solute-binding protein n=1 Tax=Priestia flexa TaxID=86664 RepID=UPI003D2F0C16